MYVHFSVISTYGDHYLKIENATDNHEPYKLRLISRFTAKPAST